MANMKSLVKAALFTPTQKGWGLPLFFWGDPGVAKTDIIETVCREYKMHLQVLSPAEHGEGAFGVIPVPVLNEKTGRYHQTYPEPDWLLKLEQHDGRGVVFVDEMPHAPPGIRPALLGLIQARRIGGADLGTLCRVLAAGNDPAKSGSGGWDLLASSANRVGHINWNPPSIDEWSNWILGLTGAAGERMTFGEDGDAAAEERRVMSVWHEHFTRSRVLITNFIKAKGIGTLHTLPDADSPDLTKAWKSRRSWYYATLAHATATVHALALGDREELVAGFVGEGIVKELNEYAAKLELPDPEQVLDGKIEFKHKKTRPDITRVVMDSLGMTCANPQLPKRKQRIEKFWEICADLVGQNLNDFVFNAAKIVAKSPNLPNNESTSSCDTAIDVLAELVPTMKAAKLMAS